MLDARRMTADDAAADLALVRASFMLPQHRIDTYAATPPEDGWVVEDRGRIVAGLKAERLAQRFGGRPVRSAAVFGVKVGPECRGRGVGRALLSRTLADLRDEGVALATLYPTDARAYRGAGFELAGAHIRWEIRSERLVTAGRPPPVERVVEPDSALLDTAYRTFAAAGCGLLERSRRWWAVRTLATTGSEPPQCFVVPGEDGPRGYLLLDRADVGRLPSFDTHCRDLIWHDADALASLLAAAAANVAVSPTVTWPGPLADPVLGRLDFPAARIADQRLWMMRVLDPRRALTDRGYPPGLAGQLTLRVADPLFPDAETPFDLAIAGGRGRVEPASAAPVGLSVRTLAALFTGWLDPHDAVRLGSIQDAGPDELELLARAFAGRPWLADLF